MRSLNQYGISFFYICQKFFRHLFTGFLIMYLTLWICFCLAGIFLRKCTRAEQCINPGSGNCLSDISVKFLFLCSKFAHIAKHRNPSAGCMCQHVDRCFHGYRICIVTVIDHGHSFYMQQIGAPGNGLHRCNALCNLPDGKSQLQSDRSSCQRIVYIMFTRNRNLRIEIALWRMDLCTHSFESMIFNVCRINIFFDIKCGIRPHSIKNYRFSVYLFFRGKLIIISI